MKKAIALMLISTFAFSLMQLCVKFLPHIPSPELILFRSIISIILSLFYLIPMRISPFGNNKKVLILRGVFGVAALSLFFATLQNMPLASAVTIQYLSPIFTAIIAIFILGEKMKRQQWFFFGLAFIGVALLKGFDERVSLFYLCVGVVSAFFSGAAYNCVRLLKDSDHPVVVVLYFPVVAVPIMSVFSWLNWVQPTGWDWVLILLLGIFTQIGQVTMTKALQAQRANTVVSLAYIGSLYALLYGYLFFGEIYGWLSLFGIVLVLAGVILNVMFREKTA